MIEIDLDAAWLGKATVSKKTTDDHIGPPISIDIAYIEMAEEMEGLGLPVEMVVEQSIEVLIDPQGSALYVISIGDNQLGEAVPVEVRPGHAGTDTGLEGLPHGRLPQGACFLDDWRAAVRPCFAAVADGLIGRAACKKKPPHVRENTIGPGGL